MRSALGCVEALKVRLVPVGTVVARSGDATIGQEGNGKVRVKKLLPFLPRWFVAALGRRDSYNGGFASAKLHRMSDMVSDISKFTLLWASGLLRFLDKNRSHGQIIGGRLALAS